MQNTWTQQLDAVVDDLHEQMVAVRRHLHAYPEVSGEEVQTTRFIAERLREAGLEAKLHPCGRGLFVDDAATPSSKPPASTAPPLSANAASRVALRADIDALWIQDGKQVAYRSKSLGVMHACGHDAHAATVLGAALALHQAQQKGWLPWPVRWRAIFHGRRKQPRRARDDRSGRARGRGGGVERAHGPIATGGHGRPAQRRVHRRLR